MQNIFNSGMVTNLFIIVLEYQLIALKDKRASLTKRVLDILGRQILNANVISGILVSIPQALE